MQTRSLCIAIALGALAPRALAQGCVPMPETWLGQKLLADLPLATQMQRQAAVDATLAANPAAVEAFLSSLMSWEFLLAHREDLAGRASSAPPAQSYSNCGRSFSASAGLRSGLDVGSESYSIEGHVYTSPLVLDFDADGLPDVSSNQWQPRDGMTFAGPLVAFDWNGDGFAEVSEWIRSDDALLVAPSDPARVVVTPTGLEWSGPISGRDLLGAAEGFDTGFAKLHWGWDSDNDGIVASGELSGLYIWNDADEDAVVDPGELHTPGDVGVTALTLPMPGTCTGNHTRFGLVRELWDWWPSYLRAHLLATGPVPSSAPIVPVALSNTSSLGPSLAVESDHRIARATLANWIPPTARLLSVSPDHSRVFMLDGSRSADDEVVKLWIFPVAEFAGSAVVPRIVPLPGTELVQMAFESETSAILVMEDGSSILRLDVTTGALTRLLAPGGGFRGGNLAIATPQGVCVSGSFVDAAGREGDEVLALVGGSSLTQVTNLTDLQATASAFGTLTGMFVVSPSRAFAVVRPDGGVGRLLHLEGGGATVLASNVAPVGLAAHGNRVLYFQEIPQTTHLRACIFDVALQSNVVLDSNEWSYPYLDASGSRALVTTFDWNAHTMTLLSAPYGSGVVFEPVQTSGIGAVRYAEDGGAIAILADEGLYVLAQTPTDASVGAAAASRLRNVPNPFNPSTAIHFELASAEIVRVSVFTAGGNLVATLLDAPREAGRHVLTWNGSDDAGRSLPSGIYLYRVSTANSIQEGKMALVR